LTGSREKFEQETGAFRSARDWANIQRDRLIAAANGKVIDMAKETSVLNYFVHRVS